MNDILIILRSLINDLDGVTYSDEVLLRLACVAAIIVTKEIYFDITYSINLSTSVITPDPDQNIGLFISYKAAILLLQNEIKTYGYTNVKIVDGPSTVDMGNISKTLIENVNLLLNQYDKLKQEYMLHGSLGFAIITPTTVEYISTNNFN